MARLRLGLAASVAVFAIVEARAGTAKADEPKASVEGVQDKALRQAIERYIGVSKRPSRSRFEARRRAEEAADDAVVVMRSEGYYDYAITPDVSAGDSPKPLLKIEPGQRFVIADPKVSWLDPAPSAKAQAKSRHLAVPCLAPRCVSGRIRPCHGAGSARSLTFEARCSDCRCGLHQYDSAGRAFPSEPRRRFRQFARISDP